MTKLPISVQMYTLRNEQKQDFLGTVKQVKQIGYDAVELAGTGNLKSYPDAKRALDEVGLKISGNHVALDRLERDLPRVIEEQRSIGNHFVICPWVPEERRRSAEEWKKIADSLNRAGRECAKAGMELCYHHHSFEFAMVTLRDAAQTAVEENPPMDSAALETSAMDLLIDSTDPAAVKFELDTYWLAHGGADPVEFIKRLGNRVRLVHLKDMTQPEMKFAEVGKGTLKFRAILEAAQEAGVAWYVVEQDETYGTPPIEAVRTSFRALQQLGVA
jgi:sugar phosphate isomerase/epimerase